MTATPLTVSAAAGARVAGVLGGLCWLARAVLDATGGPAPAVDALYWGGLALLAVALLGLGAGLVSGIAALRVLVAACLAALAWSLLAFLRGQYAGAGVDAVAGVALALGCAVGLARRRRPAAVERPDPARRRAQAGRRRADVR